VAPAGQRADRRNAGVQDRQIVRTRGAFADAIEHTQQRLVALAEDLAQLQ